MGTPASTPPAFPSNPRFGCIMGSTTGSPQAIAQTYEMLLAKNEYEMLGASEFFRCISHTVALNVAQYFGVTRGGLRDLRRVRFGTAGRRCRVRPDSPWPPGRRHLRRRRGTPRNRCRIIRYPLCRFRPIQRFPLQHPPPLRRQARRPGLSAKARASWSSKIANMPFAAARKSWPKSSAITRAATAFTSASPTMSRWSTA